MTLEEIKPDIFDINRDMPTGPASPSLPRLERVDSVPLRTRPFFHVHIIYQIGLKLDHKYPSIIQP